MRCPRCGHKMKETRGTHHKKKKWICPRCRRTCFTHLKNKDK